jgi:hypothetical protein
MYILFIKYSDLNFFEFGVPSSESTLSMHRHSCLLPFEHNGAIDTPVSLGLASHYIFLHSKLHETVIAQVVLFAQWVG